MTEDQDTNRTFGYNGKILEVDLSQARVEIQEKDPGFYRSYLGGGLLGTYYVYKETGLGVDPLSDGNVLVFASSVVTGAPVTGVSRFNISAKSPLTGAIGDAQCGGRWGPKLKEAGFDALVIRGKARRPVYLWIDQGKVQIRDASHVWGKVTGEAQARLREELGDGGIEIAQIGPAGEKLVRFASVTGGLRHFAGRTGMGAVMGSKNLKAIALRGRRAYPFFDEDRVRAVARRGTASFRKSKGHQLFHEQGTAMGVSINREIGNIVTRNFQSGHFDGSGEITGERMVETILRGRGTCWACSVRCKPIVGLESPYRIDPVYGGPEFETIIMLGSNVGIGDLSVIAKASELCNKFGMDTISTGGMIAFAIECFERGIITQKETAGLELRFGDSDVVLKLVEMIALRQGIGDLLADGPQNAISQWGSQSEELAICVKNQILPAHMPQVKPSQALMYAVNPFGADHMSSEHDWIATADGDVARGIGITDFTTFDSFDETKVRATIYSQLYYSLLDTLTLCEFCWNPGSLFTYRDLEELVEGVTGWQMSFWELMKAGERRVNLMRAFNAREGFSRKDDTLPKRVFEPLSGGESDGKRVDREAFHKHLAEYYAMMNWDATDGNPTRAKLAELGLGWIVESRK